MKEAESALQYFSRAFPEITNKCISILSKLLQSLTDFFIQNFIEKVVQLKNQHRRKNIKKFLKNLRSVI